MADKHTPGPWYYSRWGESDRTTFYVSQQDGAAYTPNYSDVGHLVCRTVDDEKLAIQEANARLIAAAPELLMALQKVIKDVPGNSLDDWWLIAKSAIDKARA